MSNATLQLGGGNFAVKDGKLLGYATDPKTSVFVSREFDFSRGSNLAATRVDANGLIEKGRENLLVQSNQFDTTWTTSLASLTSGHSGYDSSSNAWLLSKSGDSGFVQQIKSATGVVTQSIYVKANESGWCQLLNGVGFRYYDLENGVIGSGAGDISSEITSVGNGWYRISLVTNGCSYFRAYPAEADNDKSATSGSIYIQDAQLEAGLVATDYIETGATTAQAGILENMPRIDYTNSSSPALLLEPQRTNLITHSELVNTSTYYITNSTQEQFAGTSPDDSNTATKITSTGYTIFRPFGALTLSTSTTYTFTFYAKNIDATGAWFRVYNASAGSNLVNTTSYFNQLTIGEWVRVQYTFTTTATDTLYYPYLQDGNQGGSILYWGAQLEEGSYPTSYIPTYGSAVTRSADEVTHLTTTSLLSQTTNNTIYGEITNFKEQAGNARFISLFNSSFSNTDRILIYSSHTGSDYTLNAQYKTSGQSDVNIAISGMSYNERVKFAVVFDGTEMSLFVNGSLVGSSTIVAANNFYHYDPTNIPDDLGFREHKVSLFPTALTDSECIALTTL